MPKTRAVDANHGVMTDHSIPKVPRDTQPPPSTDLVAFLGKAADRSLGLAYAELGDKRAREHLLRASPSDWQVRLRLAAFERDPARAAAHYAAVLRENPAEPVALVNLGSLYAGAGRTAEAIQLWERALAANPGTEEAAINLSKILPAAEAQAVVKRYLEWNPTSGIGPRR